MTVSLNHARFCVVNREVTIIISVNQSRRSVTIMDSLYFLQSAPTVTSRVRPSADDFATELLQVQLKSGTCTIPIYKTPPIHLHD